MVLLSFHTEKMQGRFQNREGRLSLWTSYQTLSHIANPISTHRCNICFSVALLYTTAIIICQYHGYEKTQSQMHIRIHDRCIGFSKKNTMPIQLSVYTHRRMLTERDIGVAAYPLGFCENELKVVSTWLLHVFRNTL